MFDGSHFPIEENIAKTSELVKVCHEKGLSIEAEVGSIGGEEDGVAFLGTDVTVIIVIMAVYGWDRYARLTRNLSRSAYTEGYACALEGLGLPTVSIALRHILPNIASTLVVNMTLNFPGMILLETSLSFLGVGVQPPMSSLGTMLGFGRDYLTTAWWIAVIPGLVIVVSTLSMSILGDWVQQKLEPAAR